jgi:hypothetical protein
MTGDVLQLTPIWPMLLLGAYHGVNPGMGWLFAVALGMQGRSGRGVAASLPPMALGHLLAVGAAALAVGILGRALPPPAVRYAVAAVLVTLGVYRLVRHRHPRWVRMQVGFRDLTIWSFLMASAHGAGVMVAPLLVGTSVLEAAHPIGVHHHASAAAEPAVLALATLVHTVGYLVATGAVAWIVYAKLGLALLRKAWLNLDLAWALALVTSGIVALLA